MAQLFRKSSIERLSSPEQLDKSIVVTSPVSWIALLGIMLIAVFFGIWAVYGSMPSTITARGVVSGGVYTNSVYSEYTGKISEVCVCEGDKVNRESVICKITDEKGETHRICAEDDCVITKQLIKEGDAVNYSDEIFGISPVSLNDAFVVFYVGLEKLPILRSGMEAIVTLPAFDNQKYGHMKGVIVNVDKFAASESSVRRVIGNNDSVIDYLGALKQPPVAVTCLLEKDESSRNGFLWSNKKGENLKVAIGSIADVKIIVDESAPISKLIPGFDK